MDKIILKNMKFYGYHGLFPEEEKLGQHFNVDVELYLPLEEAGKTDQMEKSIDYGEVFNLIKTIVEGESKKLIETVAQSIADQLLNKYVKLQSCTIRLKKLHPPINGHYDYVAVEISRER